MSQIVNQAELMKRLVASLLALYAVLFAVSVRIMDACFKAFFKGLDAAIKSQDRKMYGRGGWRSYYGVPKKRRKKTW